MAAPETFTRRQGAVRARLHPRCGPEEYAAWLADPGSLAPTDAGPRWRGGSPSIKDPRWFVKRRTGRKGRRALEHSLDVGLALEDAGIAACLPLAVVRTGGVTWLVSEWLDGRDLDHALAEADADGRLELARRAGELVAELHAAGFRQRDLKAPNLLVVEGGAVVLVDLEGIRHRHGGTGALGRRLRAKDLGRLAASFLALGLAEEPGGPLAALVAAYLGRLGELAPEAAGGDAEDWLATILGLGRAKVRRNARRGRVLR